MLNTPYLRKRNMVYLLAFSLTQAVAVLALFLLFSDIDRINTLFLSIFGLGAIGIALLIAVSSASHPQASLGVWFIVLLALQHGGGWLLEQIFTDQHYSRFIHYTNDTLAKSLVLAGIGLLSFSCTYALYNSFRRKKNLDANCAAQTRTPVIDQIPLSILLIWGAGFLIFEFTGGMNRSFDNSTVVYVFRSLFGFLAISLVVLLSIKLLASGLKSSTALFLLLIMWGGFILLVGQRQSIIEISLSTFILSSKWQFITIKGRHLFLLLLFLLSIMVGMVYLRDTYGRDTFSMTISDQLAVLSEQQPVEQGSFRENLVYDLGYRLNAGNILLGLVADQPTRDLFWFEPITYSIVKLVPGYIWTSKIHDLKAGELPRLISNHYRLPIVDYIATYITAFYAIGGLPTLILFSSISGVFVAFLDIKLAQNPSFLGFILAIGIAGGLLMIDHSIDGLFIRLRDSLFLYVALKSSIVFKNTLRKP